MIIAEETNHFSITEGNKTDYYAKGDLLIHKMSAVANAELWFVHRQTNQVLFIVNYNDISGYASTDVDDFIDKWLVDNPIASGGGLPAGMTWNGTTFSLTTANGFVVGPWAANATYTAIGNSGFPVFAFKDSQSLFLYSYSFYVQQGAQVRSVWLDTGRFGTGTTTPGGTGHFKSRIATEIPFIVEGILGQDTDIQQWRNNGNIYGKFTKTGGFVLLQPGEGITFTSPDGLTTKTVSIDNAGNEVRT